MKQFLIRFGQVLSVMFSVQFSVEGFEAEGFWSPFWWFFFASLLVSAFVALVKLDIKKEQNA